MSNMSYCRFQNTVDDLQDCVESMENATLEQMDLSPEEKKAMDLMDELATKFIENYQDLIH